ncbi:MAG: 1-acyl-sn-glycerol-3-phosphate acyltransferase [Planctomycetes bacterium]|nr:1-acyl-sn-glycerol-3-phosphate acyltransferase [Planctomycetota bacterium]
MSLFDHRRRAPGRSWWYVWVWTSISAVVCAGFRIIYRVRAYGLDRIPRDGALLYVANHTSHFDPPLVASLVRARPCGFLARESLFRFKPFGWLIGFLGTIPLHRDRSVAGALRAAVRELELGRCVLMFPEGTRSVDGVMARFKGGVVFLARKTGARIVPVAIAGTYDIWPKGRSFPRLVGRIGLLVGEPTTVDDLGEDDRTALEALRRRIESQRLDLRQRMRAETNGRWPKAGAGDDPYWGADEATE